jgi:hypothetical protein
LLAEVNASSGLQGIEIASGINAAGVIVGKRCASQFYERHSTTIFVDTEN